MRRTDGVTKISRRGKPVYVVYFKYTDTDGRRREYRRDAQIQTAAGARVEANRLQTLAVTTGSVEPKPAAPTFAKFVDTVYRPIMTTRCRPATRERYEALLRQGVLAEFGNREVDQIRAEHLQTFESKLVARGVQARPHLSLARAVLRTAAETHTIESMPTLPKLPRKPGTLPDAPTDAEVASMLAHATGWLRTSIALAAYAGLRMGEVRALQVRDVDLTGKRITVRHAMSAGETISPKSGNERVVPIAMPLEPLLADAVRGKRADALVIVNSSGTTPTRQNCLTTLTRLLDKHGLRERSFHSLRHYFCSTLVRRGASLEAVRVLAGHSKLDVTQRYVHATGADLTAAIAKLDVCAASRPARRVTGA